VSNSTEGREHKPHKENVADRLKAKLAELESKRSELEARFKSLSASSTRPGPRSGEGGGGEWKERYCSTDLTIAKFSQQAYEQRMRVCDRWQKASTTPSVKPPRASTTPMVKVHQPNGGVRYKHRIDGAVIISWRNTTKDKTVDIDLKTGSTTTSIAKDVVGKLPKNRVRNESGSNSSATSPAVLGASTYASVPGGGGGSILGFILNGNNKYKPVRTYRWLNAPEGEGYKIVITAKDGDTTYTDESDNEFSVKKMPKGMKGGKEDDEEDGDVLGAATSQEAELKDALTSLEVDLVELLAEVSS
jgi:hypothetical protein